MSVHAARRGLVTLLTLDRPDRRNALDHGHCVDLANAVRLAVDEGARVIVLAGAGPHFCAGADLKGVDDVSFAGALREVLDALAGASVPVIAAVQGAALGAGTQLAIACDLRVAEPESRFGIPAGKLGLMVDYWTVQRLALSVGYSTARSMLLAASEIDGTAAHRLGLVQRVGTPALEAAMAWASEIATLAPLTLAGHKVALNALEHSVGADPAVTEAFARAWGSEDLIEGMTAWSEGRLPAFRGR